MGEGFAPRKSRLRATPARIAPGHQPTGEQQARVALATPAELNHAISEAAKAQVGWAATSPQRRARQTAEPVAAAFGLPVDIDDRMAEYDRGMSHYVPLEEVRAERPGDWARMAQGQLPDTVDADAFTARVRCALRDIVAAAHHRDTVAVFSHGGVINVVLHELLGTAKPLSFPIDYASVTHLRHSRTGSFTVAGVNGIEHVWDLLPRNRPVADG